MSQQTRNYLSHLFYIEQSKNRYLPDWFLEDGTREDAEKVLNRSTGSVLMRKHSSFDDSGKYVITYRKENGSFKHYIVLNTPDGFFLDIDHKNNHPVSCLSEAMDLFIRLSGRGASAVGCGIHSGYLKPDSYYDNASPKKMSGGYVNLSEMTIATELNKIVPYGAEKLNSIPSHSYLNVPQLNHTLSKKNLGYVDVEALNDNKRGKSGHGYVNVQHLNDPQEELPRVLNRLTMDDDIPFDFPPPPLPFE